MNEIAFSLHCDYHYSSVHDAEVERIEQRHFRAHVGNCRIADVVKAAIFNVHYDGTELNTYAVY